MLTNKKGRHNLIKSLLAAAVLLAVITACLAAYSMSRFSTASGGTGTTSIALWDVTITPQTNTSMPTSGTYDSSVTFGMLSPGTTPTGTTADSYIVYHESDKKSLVTLTYQTDVSFDFTAEVTSFTINYNDTDAASAVTTADSSSSSIWTNTTIDSSTSASTSIVPQTTDIQNLFTLKIYYNNSTANNGTSDTLFYDSSDTVNYSGKLSFTSSTSSTSLVFYGILTWSIPVQSATSITSQNYNKISTYLCNWVGKYVESISCDITYSARQTSELPTD